MATTSHFYVALFSNVSRDFYEQNTHADFTVKLTDPVDLGSTSSWEVGMCEISCSTPLMGEDTTVLIYSNLISPQFVGDNTVRRLRASVFPLSSSSSSSCQDEFRNVYYVPVEKRRFQDI